MTAQLNAVCVRFYFKRRTLRVNEKPGETWKQVEVAMSSKWPDFMSMYSDAFILKIRELLRCMSVNAACTEIEETVTVFPELI